MSLTFIALTGLLLTAAPRARALGPEDPEAAAPVDASSMTAASLQAWFMDDDEEVGDPSAAPSPSALADQIRFLRKGRVAELDDWQAYSDMTALVARRLEIEPPELAIPFYRGRVRPGSDPLSAQERAVRDELAAAAKTSDAPRRHRYIAGLIGKPEPAFEAPRSRTVTVKGKNGRKIKKVIVPPETAPPPRPASVFSQIDWERADELAEVADDNARGWDRKPGETLKRYRRRLRRLRSHCYEWVRRDMEALGIWDAGLFRGYVPATRRDRKRPIRAASFALAMAKISGSEQASARTSLRELNMRVDPLVRGAIVVFSPTVCDYNRRNGHIEIITSVEPLQAASFKFHPVKEDCLVKAATENKMHVYVPLLD